MLSSEWTAPVAGLLLGVSTWVGARGARAWLPSTIAESVVATWIARDEVFGWMEDGELLAAMLLQTEDATHWPDDRPGDALYLHKLAVRRSAAGRGVGAEMVRFAEEVARERGVPVLRLDTSPDGPLPAYYARLGFVADRDGPADYAGRWLIRMEKRLGQARQKHRRAPAVADSNASCDDSDLQSGPSG
jgi:GNAT superfamily N-acetyltransferase